MDWSVCQETEPCVAFMHASNFSLVFDNFLVKNI